MTWVDLSSDFGYGSQLTSTQMQQLRDNISAAFAQDSGAPALAGAGIIASTMLKTAQGSVTCGSGSHGMVLPGGEYGFYPQVMDIDMNSTLTVLARGMTSEYVTRISYEGTGTGAFYAQQRYVTASGPIHWVFVMRNKMTKEVLLAWQAPDHPCYGNGGNPESMPHPFMTEYDHAKHEIICVNPSVADVLAIQRATRNDGLRRDFLEVFFEAYNFDEAKQGVWPDSVMLPVDLPPDWDPGWNDKGHLEPIKICIPKPADILTPAIKLKDKETPK